MITVLSFEHFYQALLSWHAMNHETVTYTFKLLLGQVNEVKFVFCGAFLAASSVKFQAMVAGSRARVSVFTISCVIMREVWCFHGMFFFVVVFCCFLIFFFRFASLFSVL